MGKDIISQLNVGYLRVLNLTGKGLFQSLADRLRSRLKYGLLKASTVVSIAETKGEIYCFILILHAKIISKFFSTMKRSPW